MQPIQIGMNAAVVLVALLLAVPIQLLVSHYISKSYKEGGDIGITEVRATAIKQLMESMHSFMGRFHSTVRYYSTWGHLKELVMVPFKKRDKMASLQMKTTVFKNGGGVTTILIEPSDSKTSHKKQKSGTASREESKVKHTETLKYPTKATEGRQRSDSRGASASSSKTEARQVEDEGTSPAREVEDYLMKEVYFGQSKETRVVKPPNVKYSVGQVIKHKQDGYYGVIIGWDEAINAPESWVARHYSKRNTEQLVQSAHYLVLVDSHFDASGSPYRYLPQEDVEAVTNVQIQCPELSRYFEGYKHGRHIPKPWLQNRYPRD